MIVRHLSYFVALARERHFARAADACNITQPTLSAAIRKLEADLDVRLVMRAHRYVGLTHEGEHLLAWAQQILTDYDSLRLDLSGLRKGLEGTLRLGVIPAAMSSVAFLTTRFCDLHPAAKISVMSMTSRAIQRGLNAFEIDAGLTYLDNEPLEHARTIPLYRERYIFVTRHGGAHEGRSSITWKEATRERLCLLSEDMQNRRIINKIAESQGVVIDPTVVGNSFLNILAHLRKGGWSSIVPHIFSFIIGESPDLMKLDLVEPVHSQSIGLVFSDRDPLPPMASALVTILASADFERDLAEAMAGATR
jgi:DNA-binding transcriptional LysR family regulator